MKIILKNKHGEFEMGGGSHPTARIIKIEGLGIPSKEVTAVSFSGAPGRVTENTRDLWRTITISLDFYGGREEADRLYRIIYEPTEILCYFGNVRRRILARLINSTEITGIIYRRWQRAVLQFVCDDPYFHDFTNTVVSLSTPKDLWPNSFSGGWEIELPSVATAISNTSVIVNRGSTRLYPTIRLFCKKPYDGDSQEFGIVLKNHTTKKEIELLYNPQNNEVITIDLESRRIVSSISGNITACISDATRLSDFYLEVGNNRLELIRKNAGDLISAEAEFTNNYITAVI